MKFFGLFDFFMLTFTQETLLFLLVYICFLGLWVSMGCFLHSSIKCGESCWKRSLSLCSLHNNLDFLARGLFWWGAGNSAVILMINGSCSYSGCFWAFRWPACVVCWGDEHVVILILIYPSGAERTVFLSSDLPWSCRLTPTLMHTFDQVICSE